MIYRDNADPTRFVSVVSNRGSYHENGNAKYLTCKVYFVPHSHNRDMPVELDKLVYVGKTDIAASSFEDSASRKCFGFTPIST